jgi:hypothetical protein
VIRLRVSACCCLWPQAGAYVKEFVHGDFGRCQPSLGDVLGRVIKEVDAEADLVAEAGANAGAEGKAEAAEGRPGSCAVPLPPFVRTECVQLDVMEVHLGDWP